MPWACGVPVKEQLSSVPYTEAQAAHGHVLGKATRRVTGGELEVRLESMVEGLPFRSFYRDRSVLITGHTGFKGGWLATWLKVLGARVIGFSLPPEEAKSSFFETARVGENMISILGDIRDFTSVVNVFKTQMPEIVFHIAAQSLVRRSYVQPLETYSVNVMGTAHVLEAVRLTPSVRVVVIVTSDKCYENRDGDHAHREDDPMGGNDPYSASKGAAELVTSSYRRSFFDPGRFEEHGVSLASARAGNVIGGGDWAQDRLVPDCIRALVESQPIPIRNPRSIRPWQHVLEPLSGYLWLAARMWVAPSQFAEAWNFGPGASGSATVGDLVARVVQEWGSGEWQDVSDQHDDAPLEAASLKLDCTKASDRLGWRPVLTMDRAVRDTTAWYHRFCFDPHFDARGFTGVQIRTFVNAARKAGVRWAQEHGSQEGKPDE